MSFTFQDSGTPSAFAFVNVKKKNVQPYKIIIYLPKYNSKDYTVGNPYREVYSGPGNFRGDLKEIALFGSKPAEKVFPNDATPTQLPNKFKLRFVIPPSNADEETPSTTGTLVGLAEVSDANSTPVPGTVALRVYRAKDIPLKVDTTTFDYAKVVYVVTAGDKPQDPPAPAPAPAPGPGK